jgi:hypothetical protein
MLAGLKRLVVLLAATAVGVGGVAGLAALLAGGSVERAVSLAYYLVGAFLLVLGFFAGSRGPLRPRGSEEGTDPVTGLFGIGIGARGARRATEGERMDAVETAGIFIAAGIWLILLGVLVDGSVEVL